MKNQDLFMKLFTDTQMADLFDSIKKDDKEQKAATVKKNEDDLERFKKELTEIKTYYNNSKTYAPKTNWTPTNKKSNLLPPDDLSKMFEQFFASDPSATNKSSLFTPLPKGNLADHSIITLPLWIGEVRQGGFHDLIASISHSGNSKDKAIIKQAFAKFSESHLGDDITIDILGDGPNGDVKTPIPAKFHSLKFIEWGSSEAAEWTTPVRIELYVPNSLTRMKDRIQYGGNLYATGVAEMDEMKDIGIGRHVSSLSSVEINNIYWEDYRTRKEAVKVL